MTVYCVSRHPGAIEWLHAQEVHVDVVLAHIEELDIRAGDTVIGTLPLALAAEICAAGAIVLAICMDVPAEARGRELSAEDMRRFGARLCRFLVSTAEKGKP